METTYLKTIEKLGFFRKAYTMRNNCTILYFNNGKIVLSYDTICGIFIWDDKWYFTKYHNYSKTTNFHMMSATQMTTQERIKSIANGTSMLITDYEI